MLILIIVNFSLKKKSSAKETIIEKKAGACPIVNFSLKKKSSAKETSTEKKAGTCPDLLFYFLINRVAIWGDCCAIWVKIRMVVSLVCCNGSYILVK